MSLENTHVHTFTETVVPPTCRENGYTVRKCACGYEHKDSFVQATDAHTFAITQETAPTCTAPGSRTLTCTTCGLTKTETAAPLGHQWGAWNVQTFATCTEAGAQYRMCTRCGQREDQEIPPAGHALSSSKPSETQNGMVECFCERCGEKILQPAAGKKPNNVFITIVAIVAALGVLTGAFFAFFFDPLRESLGKNNEDGTTSDVSEDEADNVAAVYARAKQYLQDGNYEEAYYLLKDAKGYKDSEKLLEDFRVTYKEETYETFDDAGDVKMKAVTKCDKYGNVTERTTYDRFGDIKEQTTYEYEYTKYGDYTLYIEYDMDGNEVSREAYEYEYDKNGNVTSSIRYDRDGDITYKYEYEYDKNGNEAAYIRYDSDGNIMYKYEYEYDKNSNLTLCEEYDEDNLESKIKYEYDKNGNETLRAYFDGEGNLTSKVKSTYDEEGNLTKEVYYNADGEETGSTKYEYDKNGNETLRAYYDGEGDKQDYYGKCEYDENGNMTKETWYDENDEVVSKYVYEYDKKGNVIQRTCYDEEGNKTFELTYDGVIVLYEK